MQDPLVAVILPTANKISQQLVADTEADWFLVLTGFETVDKLLEVFSVDELDKLITDIQSKSHYYVDRMRLLGKLGWVCKMRRDLDSRFQVSYGGAAYRRRLKTLAKDNAASVVKRLDRLRTMFSSIKDAASE